MITAIIGASPEFYRLVDLDLRKREFNITLRQSNVRPERVKEMTDELAQMDEEIAALKPVIKTQLYGPADARTTGWDRRHRHLGTARHRSRWIFRHSFEPRYGTAVDQGWPVLGQRFWRHRQRARGQRSNVSLQYFWQPRRWRRREMRAGKLSQVSSFRN